MSASQWTESCGSVKSQHPLCTPRLVNCQAPLPCSEPGASKALKQGRGTSMLVAGDSGSSCSSRGHFQGQCWSEGRACAQCPVPSAQGELWPSVLGGAVLPS